MIRFRTALILLFLAAASLATSSLAVAQPGPGGRSRDGYGPDILKIRLYSSTNPAMRPQGLLDLFVQFANDVLTFVKSDSATWTARYDLEMLIYNGKREIAAYQVIRDTVVTHRYELTNSRINPLTRTMRFQLDPGTYTWRLKLLNAEGLPILEREDRLEVPDYGAGELQLSGILLADSLDCAGGHHRLNLGGTFNRRERGIGAIFEIYPPAGADSVSALITLNTSAGRKIWEKRINRAAAPLVPFCLDLHDQIDQPGEYLLNVRAGAGARTAQAEQRILVIWGPGEVAHESMDLAIAQLALIARGGVLREMEKARGEERERLYEAFWEKRDPTPGTPQNELKDEFFLRIDIANHQFSEGRTGRQGWRTDRGRVFIQNGNPDNIERQTGDMGVSALEVWNYNRLNRRYIFVDRLNNGEFRLAKVE